MAYVDVKQRPSPAGMAAVVAVHGAIGAALLFGLSVTGVIDKEQVFTGITITKPAPPPPPEPPRPEPSSPRPEPSARTVDRPIVVPLPPIPIPRASPDMTTTFDTLPPLPPLPRGTGEATDRVVPTPTPSFTAIGAAPRNDPNRWVTTEDYRNNWIRQEMTGKARFRLAIASDGRVTSCAITASSGHSELDAATCALVVRRARFQPARGGDGEPVTGSYSSAIDWQLPE